MLNNLDEDDAHLRVLLVVDEVFWQSLCHELLDLFFLKPSK